VDWFDPDTLTHWGAILAGHRRNRHSYRRDASQTNEPGTGVHGRRHVTNNSERNVVILKARLGKRVPRFAQVSTRHPEGGLNRVPLPDLPPPPARGRTRTLRQNYFGSPGSLFCRQMVSLSKSLTSLGRASITSVLGSAREAGLTTFSFTFDELPDLAIHSYQLRSLAPAAIEQRICSHNTRPHRVRRNAEGGGKLFLSATCSPSNGVDIRVAHWWCHNPEHGCAPKIGAVKIC